MENEQKTEKNPLGKDFTHDFINVLVFSTIIVIAIFVAIFVASDLTHKRDAALKQCENGIKEACEYIYGR